MLLLQAEASGVSQYKAYVLNDKNTTIIYQDAIWRTRDLPGIVAHTFHTST